MEIYKFSECGIRKLKRKSLFYSIPLILFILAVMFIINYYNTVPGSDILPLLFFIPMFIIFGGIGMLIGLKWQMKLFKSYQITIENNIITRTQYNTPTIAIPFSEISKITKHPFGATLITGANKTDTIFVYNQIDNKALLDARLSQIISLDIKENKLKEISRKLWFLLPIVAGVVFLLFMYSENKVFVVIAGIGLVAMMIWSFISTITNKSIDKTTKRSMYFTLLLVIVIIVKIIMVLFFNLNQ